MFYLSPPLYFLTCSSMRRCGDTLHSDGIFPERIGTKKSLDSVSLRGHSYFARLPRPYQLNRAHTQREHVRLLRRRRGHHLSTLHRFTHTQRRQIAAIPVPESFVRHPRGQSEVGQFEQPIGATALSFAPLADQNVVRLHVQMSEAALMQPTKRVADLPEQHGDVFFVEAFLHPMEKGKRENMLQILRDGSIETVFQLDEEEIVFLPRCEVSNDVRRLA